MAAPRSSIMAMAIVATIMLDAINMAARVMLPLTEAGAIVSGQPAAMTATHPRFLATDIALLTFDPLSFARRYRSAADPLFHPALLRIVEPINILSRSRSREQPDTEKGCDDMFDDLHSKLSILKSI